MAKARKKTTRKKSAKTQAAERVGELFGDPTPEAKRVARKARRAKRAAEVNAETALLLGERLTFADAVALSGTPEGARQLVGTIIRQYGDESATNGDALQDVREALRLAGLELEFVGEEPPAEPGAEGALAYRVNLDPAGREVLERMAKLAAAEADEVFLSGVTARQVGSARVVFYEHGTTRLEQIDYDEFGDYEPDAEAIGVSKSRVADAFVKVTASLRPSEREAFDGRALKERLRAAGARAVLLAVHPVAEAPDREAQEEVAVAVRPEEAVEAWFSALPVSEEDRVAARDLALEILAAEGG